MRPLAHCDKHGARWLADEVILCEAAMVDDVVLGLEDAVRKPVVAHELPDVLKRIELGVARRQGQQGDVGRRDQFRRSVPAIQLDRG